VDPRLAGCSSAGGCTHRTGWFGAGPGCNGRPAAVWPACMLCKTCSSTNCCLLHWPARLLLHPSTHPPLTVCAVPSWAVSSLHRRSTALFSVTSVCKKQQGIPFKEGAAAKASC
jgi:hypothetical protein